MGKVHLTIDENIFMDLFTRGHQLHLRVAEGIPEGSTLHNVHMDHGHSRVIMILDVPGQGREVYRKWQELPELVVAVEKLPCQETMRQLNEKLNSLSNEEERTLLDGSTRLSEEESPDISNESSNSFGTSPESASEAATQ